MSEPGPVTVTEWLLELGGVASRRRCRRHATAIGTPIIGAALGRLVSAALKGDITIDRAEELIDQLITLDATCSRMLAAVFRGIDRSRSRGQAVALESLAREAGFTTTTPTRPSRG